jgi:hypothetical protein
LEQKVATLTAKIAELEKNQTEAAPSLMTTPGVAPSSNAVSQTSVLQKTEAANMNPNALTPNDIERCIASLQHIPVHHENVLNYFEQHIKNSATPGLPVRFLLWCMNQKASFYSGGMWTKFLEDELGMHVTHMEDMKGRRAVVAEDYDRLNESRRQIDKLSSHISEYTEAQRQLLDSVASILSPEQLSKLYLFVLNDKWVNYMLDTLYL